MTLHGVTIGDKFKQGKILTCEVVDFLEKKSLVTGEIVGHICIAKGTGIASNIFEVPFATVARNRVK